MIIFTKTEVDNYRIISNWDRKLTGLKIFRSEYLEAVDQRCSVKKVFLNISQSSQEKTCARVFFLLKKRLVQVLSSEFCDISKNTFSYRTPPVAASKY